MVIYYVFISLVLITAMITNDIKNYKLKTRIVMTVSSIGIILIQGLRHQSIGHDIQSYLVGLRLSKDMNFLSGDILYNYEIGYSIFLQTLARLEVGDQEFLFLVASIIIIPIAYTIGKKSKIPTLSIIMYICLGFFLFTFSGLRQSIAFAITFFSYNYIENRNFKKFILSIVIAVLFHKSAIIFVFAYLLYKVRINEKYLIFVLGSLFTIGLFKEQIYIFIHIIYKGYPTVLESTGAYTMLIIMVIIYICSYLFTKPSQINNSFIAYRNYLLMAIAIQIFASISNIIMRAGFYYFIFIILLIPELINQQNNRYMRLIIIMVSILIALAFFQFQAGSGYLNITPYKFFWN